MARGVERGEGEATDGTAVYEMRSVRTAASVAEGDEQINSLRAANTIEAASQRAGTHRSSEEKQTTARVRRRLEEDVNPADEQGETRHQDRIAREPRTKPRRTRADRGLSFAKMSKETAEISPVQ